MLWIGLFSNYTLLHNNYNKTNNAGAADENFTIILPPNIALFSQNNNVNIRYHLTKYTATEF